MNALEQIGITKEELQQRVVEHVAKELLSGDVDYDGDYVRSEIQRGVENLIRDEVATAADAIASECIAPVAKKMIEDATLQKTSSWGEQKGEPITFKEYIIQRAEKWLTEKVDYDGKSKSERRDSYGWSGNNTRIAHLVDNHIKYTIQTTLERGLADVKSSLAKGLTDAVRLQMDTLSKAFKVQVGK